MTDTDCRDEVRYLLSRMADLQGVIARQKEMLDAMKADRDYQKVCRIFAEAALRNADQKAVDFELRKGRHSQAWSLANAIVEFRQRGRIMGSYRDAYYRAYQEALDAGSVPPRNEPMCSSFAAEVAGAVARANGEIRNLLYRAAHGKAIR